MNILTLAYSLRDGRKILRNQQLKEISTVVEPKHRNKNKKITSENFNEYRSCLIIRNI
jgi:hypothetical protein